jgi:DNA-binding NarL/FixJ family response regulator
MSGTPLVVTHPCALVRDAFRRILIKSKFRLVRVLPTLDGGAENYLGSAGICIWLLGVRECASTTNDLVRRVVAANPSVRPVILAESHHTAQDIVLALASGVFGFLFQNIPTTELIKSLELVALGQTVIHPQFHQMAFAQMGVESHSTRNSKQQVRPQETVVTRQSPSRLGTQKCYPLLSSWPCPRPRRAELRMGARLATSSETCRAASW